MLLTARPVATVDSKVNFTFASASPLVLIALAAGQIIETLTVVVDTTFNDAAATAAVGTVASPSLVLSTAQTDLTTADQYQSDVKHLIAVPEILRLTLSPGSSTQGSGYVLFRIRP